MRIFIFATVLIAACSSPANGGGGGFFTVDAKSCDGCAIGANSDASGDVTPTSDDTASASEISSGDSLASSDSGATDDATGTDNSDLDGFFDNPDADANTGSSDAISVVDDGCNARAKIVYVVTEQNELLSFEPDTLKFKLIGTLGCSTGLLDSPFSMSVDRTATAWVLYQSGFGGGGKIYQVSTLDASCKATSFVASQSGLDLFGMGFSSDAAGSTAETLYVAGGNSATFQTTQNTLATIAFPSLKLTTVGKIDISGGADLTGNGKGELYGFFPDSSPPSVRQIDKTNAKVTTLQSWPLPTSAFSNTQAWAFAQWGGDFFLFFQSTSDPSTNVWKLDPTTGNVTKVLSNIGYTVTGAGVSSCAPTAAP